MARVMDWVGALVAVVCGAALGLLFTAARGWTAWGVVPLGAPLGLVAIAAFVLALRLIWEQRMPAIAASIGVVLANGFVGGGLLGGGIGLVDDWAGWAWILAADVVAVLLAVLPAPRRRARRGGDELDERLREALRRDLEAAETTMDGQIPPEGSV